MLMASDSKMGHAGLGLWSPHLGRLFGLRDGNGNKVYPEMSQGLLKGYPIAHTNTIPSNLGAGTQLSQEIYFADWRECWCRSVSRTTLTMDFSTEATYVDTNRSLVSAFARNQSLIRLVGNHDVGLKSPRGSGAGYQSYLVKAGKVRTGALSHHLVTRSRRGQTIGIEGDRAGTNTCH